jgi:hypothetical protein
MRRPRYLLSGVIAVVGLASSWVVPALAETPAPLEPPQAATTVQTVRSTPDTESTEDRNVLTAVLNHTIRPEVQRLTHLGASAVLFLIDHTVATCDSFRSPRTQPFCMGSNAAEGVRDGVKIGMMPMGPTPAEAIPSAAHRAELITSLRARNTEGHALPVSEGLDIKLVATPPVTKMPEGSTSTSYTVFSLPGYSSAGHAVVYAFHDCGGRCGTAWLWLLEKRNADWHVRSRYVIGMF